MSELYNNIMKLCNERGITGAKLCTEIGLSKGIVSCLKTGRISDLSATNAQKIASYFGVTVGHLFGEEDPASQASYLQVVNKLTELLQDQEFIEFYESYRMLSDKNKQVVKGLIEDLL